MTLENRIRAIAGTFILISLALARWVDTRFLWFTAFIGANLLQSAFTRWCLMEDILKALGWAGDRSVTPSSRERSAGCRIVDRSTEEP